MTTPRVTELIPFLADQSVNDSPSLSHNMVVAAVRTPSPGRVATLRTYAEEAARVGASSLATDLLRYADSDSARPTLRFPFARMGANS